MFRGIGSARARGRGRRRLRETSTIGVAAVPRDIEMVVGAAQRDEQCPLVKRACSFVLRDGFHPFLDAFLHNLAEDDELKPCKQSRQLPVRFGEVRKDRLQGEMFHGFYPLRLSELINLWFDCIDCATIQDECHS